MTRHRPGIDMGSETRNRQLPHPCRSPPRKERQGSGVGNAVSRTLIALYPDCERRNTGEHTDQHPQPGKTPRDSRPRVPPFARAAFTGGSGVPVANGPASRRGRRSHDPAAGRSHDRPSPVNVAAGRDPAVAAHGRPRPAVRPCRVHGRKSRPCGGPNATSISTPCRTSPRNENGEKCHGLLPNVRTSRRYQTARLS